MLVTKYSIKRSEHKTYFFQTLLNGNVASILINLAPLNEKLCKVVYCILNFDAVSYTKKINTNRK